MYFLADDKIDIDINIDKNMQVSGVLLREKLRMCFWCEDQRISKSS